MNMVRQFQSQLDNARLARELATACLKARKLYRLSFRDSLRRGLYLVRRLKFRPGEAYTWGLFDPELDTAALQGFMSKRMMSMIQNRLNPRSWYYMTEDKGIFYRLCSELGIRSPALYALIFKTHPGWVRNGEYPLTRAEWRQFVEDRLPETFVIKPCRSLFSRGVNVYTRLDGGRFKTADDKVLTASELADHLWRNRTDKGLIMQERLTNHAEIDRLGPSGYLQTLRVLTYTPFHGEPRPVLAFLKIIRGSNFTDNFIEGGISGNLVLRLDIGTGCPREVIHLPPGAETVSRSAWSEYVALDEYMPENFRVPLWNDIKAYAAGLARVFRPLRLIGWDVAVTPSGPVVLEGNYRAGPYPSPAYREHMQTVLADYDALQTPPGLAAETPVMARQSMR